MRAKILKVLITSVWALYVCVAVVCASPTNHKMSSKGRTELKRCVSRAKFPKESDFDVQKCLAAQKLSNNYEKLISDSEKKRFVFFLVSENRMLGIV